MSSPKIVLTGVTGALGKIILRELLKVLPASQIGITVRDPSKLPSTISPDHRIVSASYDDQAALETAFKGADELLLISSNDPQGRGCEQHRTAIKAAKSSGIKFIYYTAHQLTSPDASFRPSRQHYETEQDLEKSGIRFISFRNGFYMETINMLMRGSEYTGTVELPKDGKICWTKRDDDLGIAMSKLMVMEGGEKEKYEGIVTLVNKEKVDMDEVVRIYNEVNGTKLVRKVIRDDEYVAKLVKHGLPESLGRMFLGMFEDMQNGKFVSDDPLMEQLLDGKVTSVRDMFESQKKKG